ncbi:MAG: M20/M25/M40 family metallo-hydrolase [Firmicutes bacterium]|nr:M20/M25/M40 family metallo-hydrolase [Bacillota bacterium]
MSKSGYGLDRAELREAMVEEFCELVRIDAESGEEAELANVVAAKLRDLGFDVTQDDAGSKFGGNAGNVIGRLSGAPGYEPVLLSAHLDRVTPGKGIVPSIDGDRIVSGGDTVLAADDLGGVVAILAGIRMARAVRKQLPPLEVVFTVSEEKGLKGARHLNYSQIQSKMGYIFDASSPVGVVVVQSPTHISVDATITGRAAHAAVNPEGGISAIRVAADAISKFPFGRVDDQTTANIGIISGGRATNIVCEQVSFKGEVRSLDAERALSLAKEISDEIKTIAARYGASAEVTTPVDYYGFTISRDARVVKRAQKALAMSGREAVFESTMGGSDGNIFNTKGIESIVLGMGARDVHSTKECLPISELVAAGELARDLILAALDG